MKKTVVAKKQIKLPERDAKREENQKKIIGRIIYDRKKEDGTNLIEQYFELQIEFEKKYGPNTIIMMQVGDFFEFYGVDNETEKIGDLIRLAEILNIILSRRNKKVLENSRENPQFCGFPIEKTQRFLNVLLQNNYTVVVVEQTEDCQGTTREITAVHSPGTYIEEVSNADPSYIMSIYIEEEMSYKTGVPIYFMGMSSIDLSTGSCTVYQKQNHLYDKMAIFEDMYRFMESYNPKEILLCYGELQTISVDEIMDHLNTNQRIFHLPIQSNIDWNQRLPSKYYQIQYQNDFFKRVYPDHGFYAPIEYLGLERMSQATLSFLLLLEFSHEHNESILKRIQKPELWEYPQHLILYHNTMYQLNIISQGTQQDLSGWKRSGKQYKSLFDVIQKTSTSMGRRLLKYRLMNPITSSDELEKRYRYVDMILQGNRLDELNMKLREIMDMERMHRKMDLGMIHPHEFSSLHSTYERIVELVEWMRVENIFEEFEIGEGVYENFINYQQEYLGKFDIREMMKHNLQGITDNFFLEGVIPELDDIQNKMKEIFEYFERTTNELSNLVEMGSDFVKWDMNTRDGYFMTCTKKRSEILEKKWSPEERKKYEIKKLQATTVKITSAEWEAKSNQYLSLKERIKSVAKEKYVEMIQYFTSKYADTLHHISSFIAHIDVVKSSALCARTYGYHRPMINDRYNGKSYFSAKNMRHPLIEVLNEKVIYVDNDVELLKGTQECVGILLMGLNGVGKSSMAKAIGCNIVMAQMGMYVPCREFIYYPYEKIFTRINGDDNIFKGMSSFVVEMSELRSILKYADHRSIVLGDEVCKGTEETSALSIVSATIRRFSERDVNFIMATHFHKLHAMEEIQQLENIRFKHLSVSYDENGEKVIYGRKLLDGVGDTLYGLEIAQFLIKDVEFMKMAKKTRNHLLQVHDEIVVEKKSNYNPLLRMEECMICGKNGLMTTLHTHHIKEQKDYEKENVMNIDGIQKNQLGNLVVLCEEHHEETHHGQLEIYGWKDTMSGVELDWKRVEKKKKEEEEVKRDVIEEWIQEEEEDWMDIQIREMRIQNIDKKRMVKILQEEIKKRGVKVTKKKLEERVEQNSV